MQADPQAKAIAVLGVFQVVAVFFAIGAEIATRKIWMGWLGDEEWGLLRPGVVTFVHDHGRWLWVAPVTWSALVVSIRQSDRIPAAVKALVLLSGYAIAAWLGLMALGVFLAPFLPGWHHGFP